MQRGLGEPVRSWGSPPLAIAVVSPMSDCIKTGVGKREQKFSQFLHGLVYYASPACSQVGDCCNFVHFPQPRLPTPDSLLPAPCSLKPRYLYLTSSRIAISNPNMARLLETLFPHQLRCLG